MEKITEGKVNVRLKKILASVELKITDGQDWKNRSCLGPFFVPRLYDTSPGHIGNFLLWIPIPFPACIVYST